MFALRSNAKKWHIQYGDISSEVIWSLLQTLKVSANVWSHARRIQRCQSINFKFLGSICELNDADRETKPGDYKLNDGYAYSDYPHQGESKINLYDAVCLTEIF